MLMLPVLWNTSFRTRKLRTLARLTDKSMWTYLCWKEVLAVLLGVHLLLDELVPHRLVVIHLGTLGWCSGLAKNPKFGNVRMSLISIPWLWAAQKLIKLIRFFTGTVNDEFCLLHRLMFLGPLEFQQPHMAILRMRNTARSRKEEMENTTAFSNSFCSLRSSHRPPCPRLQGDSNNVQCISHILS